jgi:hypothetical protein
LVCKLVLAGGDADCSRGSIVGSGRSYEQVG